jgi:FKBP-type peptidyl-prolyl cis-trans isomerase
MRLLTVLLCIGLVSCKGAMSKSSSPATQDDKLAYTLGYQMGKGLKDQGVTVSSSQMMAGIKDGNSGAKAQLTDTEMQEVMSSAQADVMAKRQKKDSADALTNRKAGEEFLAANKAKPGVKTTASGLQYKVLKEGSGPHPTKSSVVTVHYRGTTLSGDEFDSSYKRNEPATFPLNGVIPGWAEAVQLMTTGSKYEFVIPSELAYGERGSPPAIGPNQTLIFEVELLSFK